MFDSSDFKRILPLSLYGLTMMWAPIFGASEATVFTALAAYPPQIALSRAVNLAGFALAMAITSAEGERLKRHLDRGPLVPAAVAVGTCGMLAGCLVGCGLCPLETLYAGAAARGVYNGIITVIWIDLLIRTDARHIGAAISASLALYAAAGLAIAFVAQALPAVASLMLCACPALSYGGYRMARRRRPCDHGAEQESQHAPLKTRAALYGANLAFGIMLGTILCYFALLDTPAMVLAFLLAALLALAVFSLSPARANLRLIYRAFMMGVAIVVTALILRGLANGPAAVLAASALLAGILLYTILIFLDTQARFRQPFWRVPGICQVFAASGMILATLLSPHLPLLEEARGEGLLIMTAACVIFVASLFTSGSQFQRRPWGFTSLIPAESPEIRRLRQCGELAARYKLTTRELEILQLLAAGSGKNEIAEALVISPATAKTHVRNIYAKLGVHSQKELAHLVER